MRRAARRPAFPCSHIEGEGIVGGSTVADEGSTLTRFLPVGVARNAVRSSRSRLLPVSILLGTGLLAACPSFKVNVRPPAPPRAQTAPVDPASIVAPDSLLNTTFEVDLAPMVAEAGEKVAELLSAVLHPTLPDAPDRIAEAVSDSVEKTATEAQHDTPEQVTEETSPPEGAVEWQEFDDGRRFHARAQHRFLRAEIVEDRLEVEAEVTFIAAMDSGTEEKSGTSATQHACGCDGAEWCGGKEAPRVLAVTWLLPLTVRGDGVFDSEAPSFEFERPDRCELPRGPDGEDPWDPAAAQIETLEANAETITSALRQVVLSFDGVRDVAQPMWKQLARPVPLENGTGLLLRMRPRAMAIESMELEGSTARLPVKIAVHPLLSPAGARQVEAKALAALERGEPQPLEWPPPSDVGEARGLRIAGELQVPLKELEPDLAKWFVGRRYPRRPVNYAEIAGLRIYGSDRQAVVQLQLNGSAAGEVFLVGRIVADAEKETLSFEDMEFTPESLTALAQLYDEVERLDTTVHRRPWFNTSLLEARINRVSSWSLSDRLEAVRSGLRAAAEKLELPRHTFALDIEDTSFVIVSIDGSAARVGVLVGGSGGLERVPDEAPAEVLDLPESR